MESSRKRIDSLLAYVRKEQTRIDVKEEEITSISLTISGKKDLISVLGKVTELFKFLGGANEEELLKKIEQFVTFGLRRVFGGDFHFLVLMNTLGKDVKVDFQVQQGDHLVDVVDACGGGVAEVVGFLLQLFFVLMNKKKFAQVMILDTALVHLSDEYVDKMSGLLRDICYDLGVQIILLTHTGFYGAHSDKHYRFYQVDGKTLVEELHAT
jgi:hypothetical protein